ncbi:MAG: hypothetical protein KGN36_18415 [Acidobacteriota bacterium]|nr:hypothetical protein [Acidobacteriota bacterium]
MRLLAGSLISALLLCAQQQTHFSQVMGRMSTYHVYLPNGYAASQQRYPVIYWLHGYEAGEDARAAEVSGWVAKHDAIVVDSGPVETAGNYPLYLAELADRVDRTLRTVAGRGHRAVSGYGSGGFLALWEASKAPDLIAVASALIPARSATVGPEGFETDTALEDLRIDPESVRTRLFNSADVAAALDFDLGAFGDSPAKPATFDHADPYPNFTIWGWEAISNRKRPGLTELDDVSAHGFHSVVREWLPGGAAIPEVRLSVTSPHLFPPHTSHTVTYIRLSDGKVRRAAQRTDPQGRLTFDLDGGEYEVGIGAGAVMALSGYEFAEGAWATAGAPVKLKLRFWNKGAERSEPAIVKWESPTPGVRFASPTARVPAIPPGASAAVPVTFTASGTQRGSVEIRAMRLAIEIPVYPPAPVAAKFQILDETDHDGNASPGEAFTVALPDGRAELITSDPCVDTSMRVVEEGVRYTHAVIRANCQPGVRVHFLARTATSYAAIELPIWYKLP